MLRQSLNLKLSNLGVKMLNRNFDYSIRASVELIVYLDKIKEVLTTKIEII